VTLAALVVVHLVFLVVYGVHSKWTWATELVDVVTAITSVLHLIIMMMIDRPNKIVMMMLLLLIMFTAGQVTCYNIFVIY